MYMIIIGNVIYSLNVWKLKSNAMIYDMICDGILNLFQTIVWPKFVLRTRKNRKSNANWLLVSHTLGHANIVRFGNL